MGNSSATSRHTHSHIVDTTLSFTSPQITRFAHILILSSLLVLRKSRSGDENDGLQRYWEGIGPVLPLDYICVGYGSVGWICFVDAAGIDYIGNSMLASKSGDQCFNLAHFWHEFTALELAHSCESEINEIVGYGSNSLRNRYDFIFQCFDHPTQSQIAYFQALLTANTSMQGLSLRDASLNA